jgi:hypothetical protein
MQQYRQLGDIGRNPPRLIFAEQLCGPGKTLLLMILGYNNEAAPRQGAAFLFMLFARQADTQPNLARVPLLYVPFDFFLAFFFMTLFLAVGPLSQSQQWQQADERGVNQSWLRGNNIETARWGTTLA